MSKLQITLACDNYDRTQALRNGDVRPEGIELNYLSLPVEETFHRMVKFREFDVAEMSLSSYLLTLEFDNPPFIAIPVYTSRSFRHSGIYINTQSGIEKPTDLVGKKIGLPEYQLTAPVWIRGILDEYYGVAVESVRYRTGGLHLPGRAEKITLSLPAAIDIAPISSGNSLDNMLVAGEIDALYSPRTPRSFRDGRAEVGRLFPNFAADEADYFTRTKVFPIMHVIVIRRELYEANKWMARSLFAAFDRARLLATAAIDETVSLRYMLPWLVSEVARTRSVMGNDYWTYGLDSGDPTLSQFLTYAHNQGLITRRWHPGDIFAPEATDTVLV